MKKLRYFLTLALVMSFSVAFFAGCQFGSEYKQFEIEYTKGLEFLVGEDYSDANLKGIATKQDDSKVDVTDKMTVNTDEFKKDIPGTYKIYCEFEGIELSYEVKVVSEMTDVANINTRLLEVYANTFKRDEEGVFSYEASNSSLYLEDVYFNEYMIFNDNNGDLSIYLKYEIQSTVNPEDKETAIEFWYYGTATVGNLTMKSYEEPVSVETIENVSLEDFQTTVVMLLLKGLPVSVLPIGIDDVEFVGITSGTLVMNQDGSYTGTSVEDEETITYKDNVATEMNGVDYAFPKTSIAIIPEKPADTVVAE